MFLCSVVSLALLFAPSIHAQPTTVRAANIEAAARAEMELLRSARDSARRGDLATVEANLAAPSDAFLKAVPSVALARRAVQVCGSLRHEGEYGRAAALAGRAVQRLAKLEEATPEDRIERLYWEACLEAHFLDRKLRAIALLRTAEQLAPEDERIVRLQLELVTAVNEFGR